MSETKALTLYQIEDDLLREIAEKSEQAIQKRDNLIRFLRHLDIQIEAVDREIERLKSLKQTWLTGKERVEQYVVRVIEECVEKPKRGQSKLEGTVGVLTLRKAPDRVEITDVTELPASYVDVTITMRGDVFEEMRQQLAFVKPKAQAEDEIFGDTGLYASLDRAARKARKRDIKKALDRGEQIPGADVVFGENKLEVEEAAKRLKQQVPKIVAGVLIRFQHHVQFDRPEKQLLRVTIDLRDPEER